MVGCLRLDMIQECALIISFFQISLLLVRTNEIPIYNVRHVGNIIPRSLLTNIEKLNKHYCFFNKMLLKCAAINNFYDTIDSISKRIIEEKFLPHHDSSANNRIRELNSNMRPNFSESQPVYRRYMASPTMKNMWPWPDLHGALPAKSYPLHRSGILNHLPRFDKMLNTAWKTTPQSYNKSALARSPAPHKQVNSSSNVSHNRLKPPVATTMAVSGVPQQMIKHKNISSFTKFTQSLDDFERRFYKITFMKLTAISPADRQENGMSFVQSGFFLLITLMALWKEVDSDIRTEIEQCIGLNVSDMDSVGLVKHFISTLPNSSDKLKWRQSTRLMLWPGKDVSLQFRTGGAAALMMNIEQFNGTETSDTIAAILNKKVEIDSGGAIHDTFDEDDVSGGVTAVLVTTLYVRGRWRTAPTVLNGTRPFHDADNAPSRTARMIRINDIMKYADLSEWDAQALEISYATPGLTLLMLIPRSNSLKSLAHLVSNTSVGDITAKMMTMRVATTVPIYTLRMTLLLPNKLQAMGIPKLVDVGNVTQANALRLSHAVQRIMFWAEAGRNAYKDDGIEWDQTPELEVVVDRPYIFFVRWRNITLINGNFVL